LDSLKARLTSAQVLVAPERRELLLLHLTTTTHVVSASLVVEREEPDEC
jgi:hypothetical protein